jgi:DNA segregation ATPase FtsK/SpoIIIE-like protein
MYNPRQNQQTSTAPLNVQGTLVHDEEIHEIPTSQTSQ